MGMEMEMAAMVIMMMLMVWTSIPILTTSLNFLRAYKRRLETVQEMGSNEIGDGDGDGDGRSKEMALLWGWE